MPHQCTARDRCPGIPALPAPPTNCEQTPGTAKSQSNAIEIPKQTPLPSRSHARASRAATARSRSGWQPRPWRPDLHSAARLRPSPAFAASPRIAPPCRSRPRGRRPGASRSTPPAVTTLPPPGRHHANANSSIFASTPHPPRNACASAHTRLDMLAPPRSLTAPPPRAPWRLPRAEER
jgi:hypothetical protein